MAYKTIAELRSELDAAQRAYDGIGMMNVWGKSAEERAEIDLEYERARLKLETLRRSYLHAVTAVAKLTG